MTGPLLTTERLDLWQPRKEDLPDLFALTAPPEMRRFFGPEPPNEMDSAHRLLRGAGSWLLHGYGPFQLRRPGEDRIIGSCGVFHSWRGFGKGMDDVAEAGWSVSHEFWGQGLAGEAMTAVLAWFDATHGPRRLACMISRGNTASERLAAALGFVTYDSHRPDGEDDELVLYERLR